MCRKHQWQKILPHKVPTIYRAVAEVESYEKFLPWCISSRVLERSQEPDELRTEVKVGYQNLSSAFRSRVELSPEKRVHAVSEPNEFIERLQFTWEFAPLKTGTRLDLMLDFKLRNPEHLLLWDIAHEKVISEYVRCFSKRCVALELESGERE